MGVAKKKLRGGRLFGIIMIVFVVAGVIYTYRSEIATARLEYAVAASGKITHEVKVGAVFANQETLLPAPCAGNVSYAGADGLRLRRGETALSVQPYGVNPGNTSTPSYVQDVKAPIGGLLYQEIDGLEMILTPDNLMAMELDKLLQEKPVVKKPETVQTGEAAGKIVNNLVPSAAFVALQQLDEVEVGKTLRFIINGQQQTAKVKRKSENPKGVVVQFNSFIDGSVIQRNQDILWVERSAVSGIIIPKKALMQHGEEQGVYAVTDGIIRFRVLKVLDQDETWACVADMPEGMSVVATPREGLEGLVANLPKG